MNSKNPRALNPPNQNVGEDILLIIQEATTKIKEGLVLGQDVKKIIEEYALMVDDLKLRAEVYNALTVSAKKWEYEINTSIAIFAAGSFKTAKLGFRGFLDNAKIGTPVINNYEEKVRTAIKALSVEPPKIVTTKNGKAYTMSLRNRAEMAVRYETNLKELEEFVSSGVEYVWITSHANASPRCSPYQGKLYSINANNKQGRLDNIPYSYLPDILKLNNGNSIINGYNCRHRAVEYFKGSKPPVEYTEQQLKKEYSIDKSQRSYENTLRHLKTEEKLLRSTGYDKFIAEADRLKTRIQKLQKNYEIYSLKNNRSFNRWRAAIGREETYTSEPIN